MAIKKFTVEYKNNFKLLVCELALSFMISTSFYSENINTTNTNITSNDIYDYLEENEYLNSEDKKLYANKELIEDVIPYYKNTNMERRANSRFENLHFNYYENKLIDGEATLGYYDPYFSNVIFLWKYNKNFKDVKGHEYIHLLQSNYKYLYISEACAEIISYEYLDCPLEGYEIAVNNTKILMEIMGPEIIWNLNFSNDDTEFTTFIYENLDKAKADELLDALKKDPEEENVDLGIRYLLKELYYNVYNYDMDENIFIKHIVNNTLFDRYYFNKSKILENNPFCIENGKMYLLKKRLCYRDYISYVESNGDLSKLDIVWENEDDKNKYSLEEALKQSELKVTIYLEQIAFNLTEEEQKWFLSNGYSLRSFTTDSLPIEVIDEINNMKDIKEVSKKYNIKMLPNIYDCFENNKTRKLTK